MSTSPNFFLALVSGYAVPSIIWFLAYKKRPTLWPKAVIERPQHPKKELGLALLAVVMVMAIGQAFSAGYLLPSGTWGTAWSFVSWWINNLIIFSPIFLLLWFRKQSISTVFISPKGIINKLVYGTLATIIGLFIFHLISGNADSMLLTIQAALDYDNIRNFLPVFLEGVAIAFLFVRLKWVLGMKWAIGIPALLFAVAHIPRSLANGSDVGTILYFSVLTSLVTVIVLKTTHESRDIIWLGILHYFMDISIGAFS